MTIMDVRKNMEGKAKRTKVKTVHGPVIACYLRIMIVNQFRSLSD